MNSGKQQSQIDNKDEIVLIEEQNFSFVKVAIFILVFPSIYLFGKLVCLII